MIRIVLSFYGGVIFGFQAMVGNIGLALVGAVVMGIAIFVPWEDPDE